MNKCKICGCTDNHACEGGCFWVDINNSICSKCAIDQSVMFENKATGRKVRIVGAYHDLFGVNAAVEIQRQDETNSYSKLSLLSFLFYYKEAKLSE